VLLLILLLITEHMARVKDRLIFETKKMDAVAARKSNKEQKLRSKEAKSNKLAEKAKRKKDHFRAVEEWAETAKANRGQSLDDRDNVDSHFDKKKKYSSGGKNSKREWADKKYGYGGPRGRFKQNDPASLNDMSSYNPRGNNFPGGTKYTSSMSKNAGTNNNKRKRTTGSSGAGAHRPGKRSRDAKRSGQKAR
jgi:rRNA-processing protein EBP2